MDVSSAIPAGEAFVTSFSDMTRLMVGQSKALARKVSLAQLLDDGDHDSDNTINRNNDNRSCLLYTSPSPRDLSTSRMPSSA